MYYLELFKLYDEYFFKGELQKIKDNNNLTFEFSNLCKTTAGKCIKEEDDFIIRISSGIICNTFNDNQEYYISCGIKCLNRLECLMNVFEHELLHYIILANIKRK